MTNEKKGSSNRGKELTIIVNGREKIVTSNELSFVHVVELAFGVIPTNPNTIYTVTYKRGHGNKPEGMMVDGDVIKIKDGMIFNVTATDKS
ncbi:MAG: multiubiquitin domain-containing protein [bacterium]